MSSGITSEDRARSINVHVCVVRISLSKTTIVSCLLKNPFQNEMWQVDCGGWGWKLPETDEVEMTLSSDMPMSFAIKPIIDSTHVLHFYVPNFVFVFFSLFSLAFQLIKRKEVNSDNRQHWTRSFYTFSVATLCKHSAIWSADWLASYLN